MRYDWASPQRNVSSQLVAQCKLVNLAPHTFHPCFEEVINIFKSQLSDTYSFFIRTWGAQISGANAKEILEDILLERPRTCC